MELNKREHLIFQLGWFIYWKYLNLFTFCIAHNNYRYIYLNNLMLQYLIKLQSVA